ncbi:penicillin-binding protein 2, partial [Micromonospora sp. CPCC 205711]
MPSRSDDPRRDPTGSRRGPVRGGRGAEPRTGEPGVGGISDARAYTPRGRTIRESSEDRDGGQRRTPRANRSGDPFRPALQVLDGGRVGAGRGGRREAAPAGRAGVIRTVQARPNRGSDRDFDLDEPAPRRPGG